MRIKSMACLLLVATGLAGAANAAEPTGYLHDALQSPAVAASYQRLIAKAGLPAWVKSGGVETPGQAITTAHGPATIYSSCRPHDCGSEQWLSLVHAGDGQVAGLWVKNKPAAAVKAGAVASRITELQWLGDTDEGERKALLAAIAVN